MKPRYKHLVGVAAILAVLVVSFLCRAQLTERPGNSGDDPDSMPCDLTGLSIKTPRIRVVHTKDPQLPGGSLYLQQIDPWLGYQWGRNLTQREFRERDGVYGGAGKLDGLLLADGKTRMMSRGHANSCGICHNNPYRDGGAGVTMAKNGGDGRNTPHLFGAGLVEMIGTQLRLDALALADTNKDGWISIAEAKGKRCVLTNLPDGVQGERITIDYGSFEDLDGDGKPDLNILFNIIYVDKSGKRLADAKDLRSSGVAGYTFETQVFGFGHLPLAGRPPVSTTIRSFITTPFDIHSGLQAFDPTTLDDPDGDGFAQVSNPGCLQCVTAAGKDRGLKRGPTGISLDDPDGDGYCEEISEGDLDVAEWYLLNHPAPGRGKITDEVRQGEGLFHKIGCASCHVADWHVRAADVTHPLLGDRRFFELQVAHNDKTDRLEGKLVYLSDRKDGLWLPRRAAVTVRGVYSDFKYHDVGHEFYQEQFDGSLIKQWRTAPLWGVASTAPFGHDGANLTLDSVIRRHGSEALESRKKYDALKPEERRSIIAFLESLVLYQTDRLPTDLDGDGKISEHFEVAGRDTGIERFNPEWMFRIPGQIEGPVKVRGESLTSFALTNVRQAYGLHLKYLRDSDGDGFPDVIDPAPFWRGYRDGER
jgi:Di-haem oxidoreductase, putative peroxidase